MKKDLAKKVVNGQNSVEAYVSPRACYCFACPCSCSGAAVTVNNSGYTQYSGTLHVQTTVS